MSPFVGVETRSAPPDVGRPARVFCRECDRFVKLRPGDAVPPDCPAQDCGMREVVSSPDRLRFVRAS